MSYKLLTPFSIKEIEKCLIVNNLDCEELCQSLICISEICRGKYIKFGEQRFGNLVWELKPHELKLRNCINPRIGITEFPVCTQSLVTQLGFLINQLQKLNNFNMTGHYGNDRGW